MYHLYLYKAKMVSCIFLLHQFLFLITATTFFSAVYAADSSENANYTACSVPYSCGGIQNVSYPFWGDNRPKFCGMPDFKLSCDNNNTTSFDVFQNISFGFKVHDINTSSHTVEFPIRNLLDYCYLQNNNYSLVPNLQQTDPNTKNITLFYGCNKTICSSKPRSFFFPCSNSDGTNGTGFYFGNNRSETDISRISKSCGCKNNITVPVVKKELDALVRSTNASFLSTLHRQLIEMKYKANFNACSKCEKSGGTCGTFEGSSSNQYQFVCFRKNGAHAAHQQGVRLRESEKAVKLSLRLGLGLGTIILLIFCYGLFHVIQRWRQKKRKARFFKRNGGLLLQQQMTTKDNMVDKTKVFSDAELVKATDNYNINKILGRGGQGTVYKGLLLDGRVVAIKKSLKVDESQIKHFINEVVILSQISHRNVVQLLGCCLETEVPLLVYEFIPNGTLSQHIQNPSEDFRFTWKMRLQIAVDSAGALAYLHSASATPIYHRDVKSSNILLDEKFRAKVADFGISRTLNIDQTHLTTLVQGTLGYLDPEYFQTNQFTEKSDVYSFGVVLIELLTGQKPLTLEQSGGWKSLAMEFLLHMETSRLFDIIDPRILDEAKKEEIFIMASLAMRCLNLNGKHRPTMKEVASVLEGIRSSLLPDVAEHIYSTKENKEIVEKGSMHNDRHVASSMSYSENNDLGCSSSIEVKPI